MIMIIIIIIDVDVSEIKTIIFYQYLPTYRVLSRRRSRGDTI